jgi:hypothetical protein
LHAAFVYDFGLMIVGLPVGLYLCWKASSLIDATFGKHSGFLSAATYVYLVLMGTWVYRILFGYSKWAFPTVEMRENGSRSGPHRYIWGSIALGVLGNAAYEISKAITLALGG